MRELTLNEIKRQDFVDNKIYQLLNEINPTLSVIDWNIEIIGEIRDKISECFNSKLNICTEKEFYPFID